MSRMVVVIRERLRTRRRILSKQRATGTPVFCILNAVGRRVAHHVIKERSPMTYPNFGIFQLALQLGWNPVEFRIQPRGHVMEFGDGGWKQGELKSSCTHIV